MQNIKALIVLRKKFENYKRARCTLGTICWEPFYHANDF